MCSPVVDLFAFHYEHVALVDVFSCLLILVAGRVIGRRNDVWGINVDTKLSR